MQNTKDYVKLFFKQNKFVAFVSALVFIILSTTYSIVSWIMQVIFDYMAGNSTYSFESILLMLGGYLLVAALLFMIQRSVYPRFLEKAMNQYKEAVIKKLFKKSYSDFLITNSGTYLSVLTNDCERILETYLKNIFEFIQNIVMVVSSLTLMLYYNSLLTIIAIVIAMIPMVCSLLTARSIATREEQVSKTNESYVSLTKDILNGISVIKSFKVENEAISRYQNKSMQLEHTKKMREQTFTVVSACGTIAYMVTQFGVMVIGAWMIHEHIGTMTAGMILAFINLMNGILQPINALPRIYGGMSGAKKLITKMSDYMSNAKEDTGETIVQPLANI
ncbi:MAG: ABC transporter ATP-binding protein, partial [Lactobacillus iners]|nr:ABC transporter ATP-binding protein [Lactobacillus iners]